MAYEQTLRTIGAPASADLSASQFCFVAVNANGQLALPSAGGDAEGILQDKPNGAGVYGEVGILGVSKLVVGAAGVTAGDLLATDVNGKAVTAIDRQQDPRPRAGDRRRRSHHPGAHPAEGQAVTGSGPNPQKRRKRKCLNRLWAMFT